MGHDGRTSLHPTHSLLRPAAGVFGRGSGTRRPDDKAGHGAAGQKRRLLVVDHGLSVQRKGRHCGPRHKRPCISVFAVVFAHAFLTWITKERDVQTFSTTIINVLWGMVFDLPIFARGCLAPQIHGKTLDYKEIWQKANCKLDPL